VLVLWRLWQRRWEKSPGRDAATGSLSAIIPCQRYKTTLEYTANTASFQLYRYRHALCMSQPDTCSVVPVIMQFSYVCFCLPTCGHTAFIVLWRSLSQQLPLTKWLPVQKMVKSAGSNLSAHTSSLWSNNSFALLPNAMQPCFSTPNALTDHHAGLMQCPIMKFDPDSFQVPGQYDPLSPPPHLFRSQVPVQHGLASPEVRSLQPWKAMCACLRRTCLYRA
jgi:hypothetical protein